MDARIRFAWSVILAGLLILALGSAPALAQ